MLRVGIAVKGIPDTHKFHLDLSTKGSLEAIAQFDCRCILTLVELPGKRHLRVIVPGKEANL
jgi:hypothetical protein